MMVKFLLTSFLVLNLSTVFADNVFNVVSIINKSNEERIEVDCATARCQEFNYYLQEGKYKKFVRLNEKKSLSASDLKYMGKRNKWTQYPTAKNLSRKAKTQFKDFSNPTLSIIKGGGFIIASGIAAVGETVICVALYPLRFILGNRFNKVVKAIDKKKPEVRLSHHKFTELKRALEKR